MSGTGNAVVIQVQLATIWKVMSWAYYVFLKQPITQKSQRVEMLTVAQGHARVP